MINYNLKTIRAIAFDVDGVLSRHTVTLHLSGEPLRTVNTKDGYAIQYAVKSGLHIAIITGARTEAIQLRYSKLGVSDIYIGAEIKMSYYIDWIKKYNLRDDEVMYMGDDIPDYEIMQRVGCACCPADAAQEIKDISRYISVRAGGEGCARDVIEQVMRAKGLWMKDKTAFGW